MSGTVAATIVRRAAVWLARRGKGVSKHVGKHTRNLISAARNRPWILERTVHGVFKNPNPKKLIERALKNADIMQVQARTGHVQVIKTFEKAIGRGGEKSIMIFIRATGAIITAYPVHLAEVLASGTAAVMLSDVIVDTLDGLQQLSEKHEAHKAAMDANESLAYKIIDFFLFDSTPANEDEDLYIAQARFHQIMQEKYLAVSMDIEQRSFGPDEVSAAKQRFDDGIGGAAAAYLELQEEEG